MEIVTILSENILGTYVLKSLTNCRYTWKIAYNQILYTYIYIEVPTLYKNSERYYEHLLHIHFMLPTPLNISTKSAPI